VTDAIIAALRACAAGLYPDEAGAELLISHGGFLQRRDFADFVHTGTSISDGETLMAQIDWQAAISALHDGCLPVCGGERRILQLAASIADGFPVSLHDMLAATLSAHRSAPFGVHVLAGFAGDEGSGLAVTGAGEEAGERVDGVEQERVDLGLLIGGVLGAVAAGKAVPLCGLLLLVLAQCLGAGQAAGGGLRVSAGRLVSRG
jgi:hypothetical protein